MWTNYRTPYIIRPRGRYLPHFVGLARSAKLASEMRQAVTLRTLYVRSANTERSEREANTERRVANTAGHYRLGAIWQIRRLKNFARARKFFQ